MLLVKLIAADWPQSTSLKMYCYISVTRWVNFVSVARLRKRTVSQNDRNVIETFFFVQGFAWSSPIKRKSDKDS